MRSSRAFSKTLSALALGVFFSCAPNAPDPLYPQNRNVGALNFHDLAADTKDAIAKGTYPDSLSGWKLFWEAPVDTNGLNGIFIFADTIPNALADAKLISGSGDLDVSGISAKLVAKLSVRDTSWEIPSSFFVGKDGKAGKQGYSVRTDTVYYFSVWLRYDKDQAGRPVPLRMFLGDEYPPTIPAISDSIGQTKAVLRFDRPQDKINLFDEDFKGPLRSVEVRWWPKLGAVDSSKTKIESAFLPSADLQDTSKHQLRLELGPLAYLTNYSYVLVVTDANGLSSTTTALSFHTRDSLFPSTPPDFAGTTPAANVLQLSWTAATDTFGPKKTPLNDFPNLRIGSYTVVLNGARVDSVDLVKEGANKFVQGASWPSGGGASRFAWDGSKWTWRWPNLRPGAIYDVHLVVRDSSGNDTLSKTISGRAPTASSASCKPGYVPVEGVGLLKTFCIESNEHRNRDGVPQKSVTWTQAQQQCILDTAYLCSDSQWVRACETSPSGDIWSFGSLETGAFDSDSLGWLQNACRLNTGDSSGLAKDAISDPRCVSAWGVFDMPGNLAEWTRDVYHTSPGSLPRDSILAYTGPTDLKASSDVGTIRGGTWLKLDQPDKALPSARCRERNYPAFANLYDTLADKSIRRRPNPAGSSIGVGFRCCHSPR